MSMDERERGAYTNGQKRRRRGKGGAMTNRRAVQILAERQGEDGRALTERASGSSRRRKRKKQGSGVASADRAGTQGDAVTRSLLSLRLPCSLLSLSAGGRTVLAGFIFCFCPNASLSLFYCLATTLTVSPRAASVSRVEPLTRLSVRDLDRLPLFLRCPPAYFPGPSLQK
jgi:hypothetical protein